MALKPTCSGSIGMAVRALAEEGDATWAGDVGEEVAFRPNHGFMMPRQLGPRGA
jgi:hypothetical protein